MKRCYLLRLFVVMLLCTSLWMACAQGAPLKQEETLVVFGDHLVLQADEETVTRIRVQKRGETRSNASLQWEEGQMSAILPDDFRNGERLLDADGTMNGIFELFVELENESNEERKKQDYVIEFRPCITEEDQLLMYFWAEDAFVQSERLKNDTFYISLAHVTHITLQVLDQEGQTVPAYAPQVTLRIGNVKITADESGRYWMTEELRKLEQFQLSYEVEGQEPAPTPTEEVTATPVPTPTEEVTATPVPTPTEEVTATPVPTPTEEVTATPAPTPTEEVTSTPEPTLEASEAPTTEPAEQTAAKAKGITSCWNQRGSWLLLLLLLIAAGGLTFAAYRRMRQVDAEIRKLRREKATNSGNEDTLPMQQKERR